jgi:nitrogen fixation/metabolism regulation signal transduction histidine kinase
VTQRTRLTAYLIVLHLTIGALGVALFLRNPYWLFIVEAVFLVSLVVGIGLMRGLFQNLGFARAGVQLIQDQDFTSRIREVGQPEIDELIVLYNRMVDNLRDERTRLQEQHHFLGDILRVSPSGIVILDFDGVIATVNPAAERLLNLRAGELAGRKPADLGTPLGAALATLPANETQVLALAGARRVKCHHGRFVDRGFHRSFLLIEELTEELRQAERGAYEKLIRVMAHEVNNTVAASNSLLHSSLTYGPELSDASRPDFEQAIGIVIQRTDQLNRFMRQFAEVFKLPPPTKRPEKIAKLLEDNVRLLSARADAAGITWLWEVDDPSVSAPIDRGQMDQAVLNVLQNAVEAVGGQGSITIRLNSRNGRPKLTIEDTGPGIASEAQRNLFTPFFSTKPHGQGLGLTLVQEILAGHGFDYTLECPSGGPTRFTIAF